MSMTISSREFNQDVASAKRAARDGPVFITDRGKPAHVLMSVEEYRRLTTVVGSIADLLADDPDIAFDAPRLSSLDLRPAELDG